jgi:hypothetical protein
MSKVTFRRIAIFGAPIGLGVLAAIHPMTPEDNVTVWNLIHALQIPLAALLGIGVLLLLHGVAGSAARAARMAVVAWVAFFAAYDGVAGIATGSLTEYGHSHPETADTVISAATSMVESPFTSVVLPFGAVAFALVVFGGAALALRRSGVSRSAAIAVGVGGVVWTLVHPLIGAPAMLVFLIGAVAVELSGRKSIPKPGGTTEEARLLPVREQMSSAQRAGLVGASAVALLIIVLVSMHLIQPGLSPIDHLVSEYALGQLGWLVMSGYVVAGTGTLLLVWPLISRFGKAGWALASAGSLTVVGLGFIASGLTRIDVAGADGVLISTSSGQLHELASYVALPGLIAGAFAIHATFRREHLVSSGASTFRLFKLAVVASLIGVLLARPVGVAGLGQRAFLIVTLSWLILIGIHLSRINSEASRTVRPQMDGLARRDREEQRL